MQQIIVYVDQGVDGAGLKNTVKSLQAEVDLERHRIVRMDAKMLKSASWEADTCLIVIPGGRDVYYHEALDPEGTLKIRRFVEEGGSYLGICAGAYFAASAIEFEKGGSYEVCEERSLRFFPGIAEGSAYGKNKYRYDSLQGVEAASLTWKEQEPFYAYFHGGCRFLEAEKYENVEILGTYSDLENSPAAIVLCQVGKGKAALTGVHLEYSAPYLYRFNPYLEPIYPLLQQGEESRRASFRLLLESVNVNLTTKAPAELD